MQIKLIWSETDKMHDYGTSSGIWLIRSGNDCQIRDLFVALIKIKLLLVMLVVVFKSDYMTRRANGIF